MRITSKDGEAVLLSWEDYETLLETLHLVSIPGIKESLDAADHDIAEGTLSRARCLWLIPCSKFASQNSSQGY